jgi:hypothetical protein
VATQSRSCSRYSLLCYIIEIFVLKMNCVVVDDDVEHWSLHCAMKTASNGVYDIACEPFQSIRSFFFCVL